MLTVPSSARNVNAAARVQHWVEEPHLRSCKRHGAAHFSLTRYEDVLGMRPSIGWIASRECASTCQKCRQSLLTAP